MYVKSHKHTHKMIFFLFEQQQQKTTQLAPLKSPSTIELKNHNKNKYEENIHKKKKRILEDE